MALATIRREGIRSAREESTSTAGGGLIPTRDERTPSCCERNRFQFQSDWGSYGRLMEERTHRVCIFPKKNLNRPLSSLPSAQPPSCSTLHSAVFFIDRHRSAFLCSPLQAGDEGVESEKKTSSSVAALPPLLCSLNKPEKMLGRGDEIWF
ncbi:unnamed protein product [Linum tenue]|uniref:Uncharacterized protein n=1 Tax=Linum tenue TaxID=586396 RepID=A0AAV0JYD5_9ROSI|nr:unnamed protein product [Linum tenue]